MDHNAGGLWKVLNEISLMDPQAPHVDRCTSHSNVQNKTTLLHEPTLICTTVGQTIQQWYTTSRRDQDLKNNKKY